MRKLIAIVAVLASFAFTSQPAASPRSETPPTIDPVLLNAAQRPRLTPTQQFLTDVQRAYALVLYVETLRAQHAAAVLAAAAAKAERSAAQPRARVRFVAGGRSRARSSQPSSGRCGGDLPPCYV